MLELASILLILLDFSKAGNEASIEVLILSRLCALQNVSMKRLSYLHMYVCTQVYILLIYVFITLCNSYGIATLY